MNDFAFRMMTRIGMPIRDLLMPPDRMLAEASLEEGWKILDYGCGPGTFVVKAAEMVGPGGEVIGTDITPLALEYAEKRAARAGLDNVRTLPVEDIRSITDGSMDRVLLFDVYHFLPEKEPVLAEIHRVLRAGGCLCFSDHHLDGSKSALEIIGSGLFEPSGNGRYTQSFAKIPV